MAAGVSPPRRRTLSREELRGVAFGGERRFEELPRSGESLLCELKAPTSVRHLGRRGRLRQGFVELLEDLRKVVTRCANHAGPEKVDVDVAHGPDLLGNGARKGIDACAEKVPLSPGLEMKTKHLL
jgi:hypothetical protein